ncbi:GNAT family N-acetyltransferase [Pseudorhodobacter ferrugineus]|uniref:GNAT family N-acetyltransferase n=1 Tax=Pseudorhodobacter ferrugineus TaxID=77008 RepID=UPI0003B4025C|nr:GNAT family N-acetyltransferase [Pseudorhodobacter ferrugineus]
MSLTIRPPMPADRTTWDMLYQSYATFYNVAQTPAMRDTVWSWLMDDANPVRGLVAEGSAGLVGLAHFRPFARPLSASTGGFLDDLFVAPAGRGQGVADALIGALRDHGRAQGWTVIRWITADDNYRARAVYDRLADKTKWATYDINL